MPSPVQEAVAPTVSMRIRPADHDEHASVNVIRGIPGVEIDGNRYTRIAADRYPREADRKPRALRNLTSLADAGVIRMSC